MINFSNLDFEAYLKCDYEIYDYIKKLVVKKHITCPVCGGYVLMNGIYTRNLILSDQSTYILKIAQVKCANKNCGKTHAVLPEFIYPYKRYSKEVIKDAVIHDWNTQVCQADNRTIARWKGKKGR